MSYSHWQHRLSTRFCVSWKLRMWSLWCTLRSCYRQIIQWSFFHPGRVTLCTNHDQICRGRAHGRCDIACRIYPSSANGYVSHFCATLIGKAVFFSNLDTASEAYSTWLTRGQHATRPAYISVCGRTYLLVHCCNEFPSVVNDVHRKEFKLNTSSALNTRIVTMFCRLGRRINELQNFL